MKRVICMRHAIHKKNDVNNPDGLWVIERAKEHFLSVLVGIPHLVLVSPQQRAQQTAELFLGMEFDKIVPEFDALPAQYKDQLTMAQQLSAERKILDTEAILLPEVGLMDVCLDRTRAFWDTLDEFLRSLEDGSTIFVCSHGGLIDFAAAAVKSELQSHAAPTAIDLSLIDGPLYEGEMAEFQIENDQLTQVITHHFSDDIRQEIRHRKGLNW